MRGRTAAPETVEAYLAATPPTVRRLLARLRAIVREEAPEATERIAYGMPAFELGGPLVYFAAFPGHIGFYALPSGTAAFRAELAPYRSGKGSVQFPLPGEPPWALVRAMVRFRVEESAAKARGGSARKPRGRAAGERRPAAPAKKVSRRAAPAPGRAAPRR
jgi:uncharacterized protein YdhG (YjbR/CyaY superfamily)